MEFQLGVGVDIESISRFRNLIKAKDSGFLNKIYTLYELDYIYEAKNTVQLLAQYFCAKEAIIKSLTTFNPEAIHRTNINIECKKSGAYLVKLHEYDQNNFVQLSTSYSEHKAIAFAIAVEKNFQSMLKLGEENKNVI